MEADTSCLTSTSHWLIIALDSSLFLPHEHAQDASSPSHVSVMLFVFPKSLDEVRRAFDAAEDAPTTNGGVTVSVDKIISFFPLLG